MVFEIRGVLPIPVGVFSDFVLIPQLLLVLEIILVGFFFFQNLEHPPAGLFRDAFQDFLSIMRLLGKPASTGKAAAPAAPSAMPAVPAEASHVFSLEVNTVDQGIRALGGFNCAF